MKFTKSGSVQLIAGVIAGASVVIAACSSDDSTDTSSTTGADAGGSSGSTSSAGGTDGGTDAATDGGGDAGGKTANGGACQNDVECQSGHCFQQDYCTITCTKTGQTDPVCQALGGNFTGKCNQKGFCQMK